MFTTAVRIVLPLALLTVAAACETRNDLGDLLDDEPELDGYDGDLDEPGDNQTDNPSSEAVADFDRVTYVDGFMTTDFDEAAGTCSMTYYFEFIPAAEPTGCAECDYTFVADLVYSLGDCSWSSGSDLSGLAWGIDVDSEALFVQDGTTWYRHAEGFATNKGYEIEFDGSSGWVDAGDYSWRETFSLAIQ